MDCLKNLIGVWDQCGERAAGIKYINDLPGFELSMADYLTGQEQQTGLEVIQGCINNAADEVETELRSFLDPRMRLASVVSNSTVGYYADNKNVKPSDPGYLGGVQLEIGNSHYLAAYISSITVFTPNTITDQNLYIYELTEGRLLETIQFSAIGGEYSIVQVNKKFNSNGQFLNLFVCHDAVESYRTDVILGGCGTCGWQKYLMDGYLYGRSAKLLNSAIPIENSLRGSSHSYGISVNYQLVCDSSKFICGLASRLKMAMYYKAGIMWCNEIIYGKRLNSLTTVQKPDATNLKTEWIALYENAMKIVLENIALPNDVCFQCESIISVKPAIP